MFDDFDFLFENYYGKIKKGKTKKKVSFYKYIYVYLIPIYYEMNSYQELWWTEQEITNMKKSTMQEIQTLMKFNPSMEFTHARKLLFQPNNICYDPSNFVDCE
jgi:hypothetical protein